MANKRDKLATGQATTTPTQGAMPPSFTRLLDTMAQAGQTLQTNLVVVDNTNTIQIGKFTVRTTGLEISDDVSLTEWQQFARYINRLEQGLQWVIGDLFLYAQGRLKDWFSPEEPFELRYQDLIEGTGYSYKTLRNIVSICGNVRLSQRRDNLTFSHHAEVAYLPENDQSYWLQQAEINHWSSRQLRAAIQDQPQLEAGQAPIWEKRLGKFEGWITKRRWRALPAYQRQQLRERIHHLLQVIDEWDTSD